MSHWSPALVSREGGWSHWSFPLLYSPTLSVGVGNSCLSPPCLPQPQHGWRTPLSWVLFLHGWMFPVLGAPRGNPPWPDLDLLCQWKLDICWVRSGSCPHPAILAVWASPLCLSLPIYRVCVPVNGFESLRKKNQFVTAHYLLNASQE